MMGGSPKHIVRLFVLVMAVVLLKGVLMTGLRGKRMKCLQLRAWNIWCNLAAQAGYLFWFT